MATRKPIRPRKMFAPEEDGFLWVEFAASTAREARERWCNGWHQDWAQWRKDRPNLRIIRIVVTPEVDRG